MMQNFGLEDLSHVQSGRNLLKYLVRVEMASDWFTRFYPSILAEEINHLQSYAFIVNKLRATDSSICPGLISKVDSTVFAFPFRGSGPPFWIVHSEYSSTDSKQYSTG